MSIFGWSYPPGCSGPPDDEYPCEVCGKHVDACICPECPECGCHGDKKCYNEHGLIMSQEQMDSYNNMVESCVQRDRDEAEFLEYLNKSLDEEYKFQERYLEAKLPPKNTNEL
jgi:hypothetical protein